MSVAAPSLERLVTLQSSNASTPPVPSPIPTPPTPPPPVKHLSPPMVPPPPIIPSSPSPPPPRSITPSPGPAVPSLPPPASEIPLPTPTAAPVGGGQSSPPTPMVSPPANSPLPNAPSPTKSMGSPPSATQPSPASGAAPSPSANPATPPPASVAPPPPVSANSTPPLTPPVINLPPAAPSPPALGSPPPARMSISPPVVPPPHNIERRPPIQSNLPSPTTHSSSATGSGGGGGTSTSVIVAITVGGAAVVIMIAILVLCLTRKRFKRDQFSSRRIYGSAPGVSYSDRDSSGNRRHRPVSPRSSSSDAFGNPFIPPQPPPGTSNIGLSQSIVSADAGSRKPVLSSPKGSSSLKTPRSWFTYPELELATGGFSRANLLGEGGFGYVYRGQLEGGQMVAVKQLKLGGGQGEREFRAEVDIITRIHHRHLVSLVGYCIADSQRLLVYDFVPNGTLEHHLHGKGSLVLDWATRLKIAIGAARGLAYLHEDCIPRIIHRDIKSSNILLDNNFEAQVSDFGLAKLASDAYTHVTTRVMGTFGYLAPEYASSGKLTDRSDVYSFGVVLLELITGRRPVDTSQPIGQESLVEWARPLLSQVVEDGTLEVLADPKLDIYDEKEMLRMIDAAAACVRYSAHKRPRMGHIIRALENEVSISDLNQGVKPGESTIHDSYGSIDFDSSEFSIDMRGFRRLGQNTQGQSIEYSAVRADNNENSSADEGKKEDEERNISNRSWLSRSHQKSSLAHRSSRRSDESEWPLRL